MRSAPSAAAWVAASILALSLLAVGQGHVPYPKPQSAFTAGQPAPDFTLKDQDGRDFSLRRQRGRWVLLFFYRGYW